MDRKEIVRTGYNTIAPRYLASRSTDSEDIQLLPHFTRLLPGGGRVLDAGCGAGVPVTRSLAQSYRVVGVDFAEQQVQLARQLVPQASFTCQDLAALGFAANTFDGVCSYYAIIHIPRTLHPTILAHFQRVLKPGGTAFLCMGAEDLDDDIEEDYLGARMYWSHYDADKNLQLMREAGFEILESHLVDDSSSPGSAHLFVLAQARNLHE